MSQAAGPLRAARSRAGTLTPFLWTGLGVTCAKWRRSCVQAGNSFLAETGRGLQIICALSDRWGYTALGGTGKVVWATFTSH